MSCHSFLRKSVTLVNPRNERIKAEGTTPLHLQELFLFEETVCKKDGSDGYNAYIFIGDELRTDRYKDADHEVCLAHVRAKLVKARMESGDKRVDVFVEI